MILPELNGTEEQRRHFCFSPVPDTEKNVPDRHIFFSVSVRSGPVFPVHVHPQAFFTGSLPQTDIGFGIIVCV